MEAMSVSPKELQENWASIRPVLMIRNEREYDRAVRRLNSLLDEVGTNERHPLYGLLDTLGTLIHAYEDEHFKESDPGGPEMLRYFMEEHGLKESELPEIGSQRAVSEVLKGKRELTAKQIRALASRFHVSPAVFV
jgi:HTH-type transcriptional regulator/antitoxin HigA